MKILYMAWTLISFISGVYLIHIGLTGSYADEVSVAMPLIFIMWFAVVYLGHAVITIIKNEYK